MNPLGIALQGIGLAAAFVALQGFGPAEEVSPPVDQQVVASVGGGSGGFAGVTSTTKRKTPIEIPIANHNEDDEEEIVLALLMRIAQLEYFE